MYRTRLSKPRGGGLLALLVLLTTWRAAGVDYPPVSEITRGDLAIVVEDYAALPLPTSLSGRLSRVSVMRFEPGTHPAFTNRAFVADLRSTLYVLDLTSRQFTTYIDLEVVFPKFVDGSSYGAGLATLAFDPDYASNGRFYTVHTESPALAGSAAPTNAHLPGLDLSGGYDVTISIDPPVGSVARHAVLVEWTDLDLTNRVFEGTAREVLRVGFTKGKHSIGDMLFNPAALPADADYGNLYIALGDGGAGEEDDTGHSIPQRLDTLPGKILRITPDPTRRPADALSDNGRYRVPTTGGDPNPFIDLADASVRREIYAYGFRNPQRMSWDVVTNTLIAADIGLASWEELNIIRKGANYGYAEREGTEQLFVGGLNDGLTGSQTVPPSPLPDPDVLTVNGLAGPVTPTYPVAAYSHRDGDAIAGGFVYRGNRMPQLVGKYLFGDITTARLFYVDLAEMMAADDGDPSTSAVIHELNALFDDPSDVPSVGAVPMRLFDIIASRFASRGGTTNNGAALPEAGDHMSDALDPDGIPYGGGRADIRFAEDREGELYILSKSDGMIRTLVAARGGGTTTVLTAAPTPSAAGDSVAFTARVRSDAASLVGSVRFAANGAALGERPVSDGISTLTTSDLDAGLYLVTAEFIPADGSLLSSRAGRQHLVYSPATYPMTVTVTGSATGTVTSAPAGIACPDACATSFDADATVTLTPTPANGSMFAGWSGACTGAGSCVVTMNDVIAVTATFIPGQPDLLTHVDAIPGVSSPGAKIVLTETTQNAGTATATGSTTRFFLSLDGAHDVGDITLGGRSITTLLSGASSAGNTTLTVPAATSLGSYYVIACADATAKVNESSEQNNCMSSAARLALSEPDLITAAINDPVAYVATGGTFTIRDTVINEGGYASVASVSRHYLSTDITKSAADILLSGTRSIGILSPQASSTGSTKVKVPSPTALGMYFVIACADDTSKNTELSEANNCRTSAAQIRVGRPDLIVSTLGNPPTQVAPGQTFEVSAVVRNQGDAAAPESKLRYYLSTDDLKDASDALLTGTSSVASLAPGSSVSPKRTVTVPTTIPAGTYWLVACADDLATVMERDEGNNCAVASTTTRVP